MSGQEEARTAAERWLVELVRFDTVSRNSNLPMLGHIRQKLADMGVAATVAPDASGEKAGLLATIGPDDQPGIVFSGHMDVVPVDGQDWSSDPFSARFANGRIYGRGTCDMKGFLAAVLAAVPEIRAMELKRPVHLAFSHDEEIGCKGSEVLLEHMRETLAHRPMGCVVGEPTGMRPVDGHKGKIAARVKVTGRPGHSALTHETVNAVLHAGQLIAHVAEVGERLAADPPSHGAGFMPPHTTMSVGRIEGGSQINIVPGSCTFEMEFRTLPEEKPDEHLARVIDHAERFILPAMRERASDARIEFSTFLAYPGYRAPVGDSFVATCVELCGGHTPGKVSYGTEAGWFQAFDIPTIVCGPGHMSVAHKADEYVEREQLARAQAFILDLVRRLAT